MEFMRKRTHSLPLSVLLISAYLVAASYAAPAQLPPPPPPAKDYFPGTWDEYTSRAGKFRIRFPKQPRESVGTQEGLAVYTLEHEGLLSYRASSVDFGAPLDDLQKVAGLFQELKRGALNTLTGVNMRVVADREVTVDGHRGIFLHIEVEGGEVVRIQWVVAGPRLYTITTSSRKGRPNELEGKDDFEKVASGFIGSFHVIASGDDRSPAPSGSEQGLYIPPTRLAYVDTEYLAENGIRLDGNGAAKADLKTFSRALNVQLFDIAKLQGVVFIGDDAIDVTDVFRDTLKAKPSEGAQLKVPTITVPDAKVVLINTDTFADPKLGITRLAEAFATIEREFGPRRDEIRVLREQLSAASGDEKKRLEDDVTKREKAGRSALDKRVKEVTTPIYDDIGKALLRFCKLHGISLVFDMSKIKVTDRLPPFDLPLPAGAPDVTADFVSAYNQGALRP